MLREAQSCLWEHCQFPQRRKNLVFSQHLLVLVLELEGTEIEDGESDEGYIPFAQRLKPDLGGASPRVLQLEKLKSCSSPHIALIFRGYQNFTDLLESSNILSLKYLPTFYISVTSYFPTWWCSVTRSYQNLCQPIACSTPGFPVLICLPEFAQTPI